jgi:hypothetical protein
LLAIVNTTYLGVDDGANFQSWVSGNLPHNEETNRTAYYRWLVSFYSALCMLLGENVAPVESLEFWVHTMSLLLGAILQAYIFGQVALLIADQNSTSVKWKQKMKNVIDMMRALNLPKELQIRITNYYEYFWHRHRGVDHSIVFADLSGPLMSEVSLCLHSDHVQKVPFFRDCQVIQLNGLSSIPVPTAPRLLKRIPPTPSAATLFGCCCAEAGATYISSW